MQVMLAFAAAAGVVGGADRGMIVGFIMGLMFDLGTGGPLGASALTFGFGALVASRITSILIEREWWLSAIFVALGAAAGEAAVPVLRALIGDPVILGINTLTNVVVVGVAAGVMSPVLVPLASWALRISATPMRVPAAIE
jgi:rod shape-determining protein MreD